MEEKSRRMWQLVMAINVLSGPGSEQRLFDKHYAAGDEQCTEKRISHLARGEGTV